MNEDLDLMKQPIRWPCWPLLPVKRIIDGEVESCFIFANNKPIVYRMNMFAFMQSTQDWSELKKTCIEYESYEKIIADGWIVD